MSEQFGRRQALRDALRAATIGLAAGLPADSAVDLNALAAGEYLVLSLSDALTSERQFVAGAGLLATDGGVGAMYTVDVGAADTSIAVTADAIAVNLASPSGLVVSTGLQVDDAIAGGGLVIASKVLAVGAGTLISVGADAVSLSDGAAQYQVPVTGATPFTPAWADLATFAGGGLVFSSGVFAVGAGAGITVNADDVALTTPGSLSATSINLSAGNHTHAIDGTIARGAIIITAGAGLTGGGDLTANRVIDVVAGDTSIAVAADSIAVNLASPSGLVVSSGLALADSVAGAGLTIASKVLAVGAGAGITINANDVALTTPGTLTASSTNSASGNHTHAIDSTIARTAITITAGAGLTGGGDLSANRTIDIATADASMTINADSIQVRLAATSGLAVSSGLMIADAIAGAGLTITSKVLAVGQGDGVTIAADTVGLTTPGTLTVSSGNASAGNHTHAITNSSNPGAAATILATAADGGVQLVRLGIGVDPSVNNAIMMVDDAWIGLGSAGGRIVFDATPTPDAITFQSADVAIDNTSSPAGSTLHVGSHSPSNYGFMPGAEEIGGYHESASGSPVSFVTGVFGAAQSAATTGGPQALEGYTYTSHASGTVALALSVIGNYEHDGAGAVTEVRIVSAGGVLNAGAGNITQLAFFHALALAEIGDYTGTITDAYHFLADGWPAGINVTRKWGFYQTGADPNVLGGPLFIGDTTNANMTIGLTINQGANDNQAIALKSSDVAHGMTDFAETDTYADFRKESATAGGLRIQGWRDADDVAGRALALVGILGEAADTTKSTAAIGVVQLSANIRNGTSVTVVGANGNLAVIANGNTARFIFDAEGDSHQDVGTAWTNFDEHDDLALLTALSVNISRRGDPIRREFSDFLNVNRKKLERLKLVTFNRDGHHFVNWSKLSMLLVGSVRQLSAKVDRVVEALSKLGIDPAML